MYLPTEGGQPEEEQHQSTELPPGSQMSSDIQTLESPREDSFRSKLLEAYPRLLALALALTGNRADADDLVQETVASALTHRAQFVGGNLLAWAATILRNEFRDNQRSAWHRYRVRDEIRVEDFVPPDTMLTAEAEVMLRQVVVVLAQLGDQCRQLLILSAQGFKTREIAEFLSIPEGTAMRGMFDCRRRLQQRMNSTRE